MALGSQLEWTRGLLPSQGAHGHGEGEGVRVGASLLSVAQCLLLLLSMVAELGEPASALALIGWTPEHPENGQSSSA